MKIGLDNQITSLIVSLKIVFVMSLVAVKENIVNLNPQERTELIHFLVDLMEGELFYLSDAWKQELEAREKRVFSGASVGKAARDVLAKYVQQ
jgi:Mor family transcriptional regulator